MKRILSFSGGKDSTALLIRLHELDQPPDEVVFCDNGLEYPEVYQHIRAVEKFVGQEIKRVKPEHDWDYYFYKPITSGKYKGRIRGFPFVITPYWASRALKLRVLQKFQKREDTVLLGITYDEKHRIQKDPTMKTNSEYPLIKWKWTEKSALNTSKKKNIIPPLYNKFKRTGCWLCPKQSMKSLFILHRDYPDLWKKLKAYETDCWHGFKPNIKLDDLEKKWKSQTTLLDHKK